MKLTYSPASPFVRKVRIAATELGLMDRITVVPTAVTPGQPNADYARDITPVRKIPALILDNGDVLIDSFTIVEYLDDLAGGGKLLPLSGRARWQVKSEHTITQGMLDAMLLCRYEKMLRPEPLRWQVWYDDQWDRAWQGLKWFEARPQILDRDLDITQIALACVLGYADFRFSDCNWREHFPKLAAFNESMLRRASVADTRPPPA